MQLVNGHISGIVCSAHAFTPTFLKLLSWKKRIGYVGCTAGLWSTQHPTRIKQGQTGKALQIFNSSVQCGMSASFNRVCISFVQRSTRRYTKWKYVSWYLLYIIFFFCVYSVCYIRSVTIHFLYLAQIIYVSLAYVYSEYMCVFIHLSVHVTVHVWTYPGAYTATLLALTIHFLFCRVTCFGDSSSCMKWTGTRSTQ